MTLVDIFPLIMAAVIAAGIIIGKLYVMHENKARAKRKEDPLTKDPEFVNVIDWTRR